jgi:hypothetical protein
VELIRKMNFAQGGNEAMRNRSPQESNPIR